MGPIVNPTAGILILTGVAILALSGAILRELLD